MTLPQLLEYSAQKAKEYPQHKREIMDFYQLASDEIEEGGSEVQECLSAQNDIEQLVGENRE